VLRIHYNDLHFLLDKVTRHLYSQNIESEEAVQNSLIETAKQYGRRSAECTHKRRDIAMARRIDEYQRGLERGNPEMKADLVAAFREAYREEASYYLNSRPMSM
jgi:hypothetical protein